MAPYAVGDTITYDITVYNQGTVAGDELVVYDHAPVGLTFDPAINAGWFAGTGSAIISDPILPGDSVVVNVLLIVNNMGVGVEDYTNYAEIGSVQDTLGNDISGDDQDSTPDDDDGNDPGGEPGGDTDDTVDGENGDEDDQDPALIEIVDMALKKELVTAGPYAVGDTVEFAITVYNQGNITMDSVVVNDYVPAGYTFDASGTNSDWTYINDSLYQTTLTGGIAPDDSSTVTISLVIEATTDSEDYINVAELSSFQDEDGLTMIQIVWPMICQTMIQEENRVVTPMIQQMARTEMKMIQIQRS